MGGDCSGRRLCLFLFGFAFGDQVQPDRLLVGGWGAGGVGAADEVEAFNGAVGDEW